MKLKKKGVFTMLAVDQRTSFVKTLKKYHKTVGKNLVTKIKKEIIETLSPYCSAVLIDPVYSIKLKDLVKKNTSLLFCLEKSPAKKTKQGILTEIQKGFTVAKAKKLNANAIKLNLHYNPVANKKILQHQQKLVKKIGKECKKYKLPFLLEIIVYPLNKNVKFEFQKPLFIIDSAKEFSQKEYNVKILKLQFPFDKNYSEGAKFCKLITRVSKVPWVLLTAGVDIKTFSKQLQIAVKNGCKGFLAGRAVWQDALKIKDDKKRLKWLQTKGLSNLNRIINIARRKK